VPPLPEPTLPKPPLGGVVDGVTDTVGGLGLG
jgi:hypothetical protein